MFGSWGYLLLLLMLLPALYCAYSGRLAVGVRSRTRSAALHGAVVALPLFPVLLSPSPLLTDMGISLFQEALLANGLWFAILLASSQKSLTRQGLYHATALGVGLWSFLGPAGWLVCVSYLVLGSLVTKIRFKEKEVSPRLVLRTSTMMAEPPLTTLLLPHPYTCSLAPQALGIAEKRGGARGPENVWGSAATAMVCALLTSAAPGLTPALKVAYVASLATKLSDTFQSEIGKAYGKTTYLITTLKKVPRGTEGAVSLEGTLAGVGGSLLLIGIAAALGIIEGPRAALSCVAAAIVATTAESFIGATFQDSVPWLTNELVNLINTLIGAAVAAALYCLIAPPL